MFAGYPLRLGRLVCLWLLGSPGKGCDLLLGSGLMIMLRLYNINREIKGSCPVLAPQISSSSMALHATPRNCHVKQVHKTLVALRHDLSSPGK
jgi:hypothetical protein